MTVYYFTLFIGQILFYNEKVNSKFFHHNHIVTICMKDVCSKQQINEYCESILSRF